MTDDPGTLSFADDDSVVVRVGTELFFIRPADAMALLVEKQVVPVCRSNHGKQADGTVLVTTSIEGHAAIAAGGRGVVFHLRTRDGIGASPVPLSMVVPLVSVRCVARGEATSAPLFPLEAGVDDE